MPRDTRKLVEVLLAVQGRIGVFTTQLEDGTATPDEQRNFAGQIEELVDLLCSHADDVDAGIVPARRCFPDLERETA